MAGPDALQREVRRTMLDAGGYWRPLAAVARLLEELGELAELLESGAPSRSDLEGELADLWIITTALADQFLIQVRDPAPAPAGGSISPGGLMSAAGPIARVINFYDGPKTPRAGDRLPSLTDAVGGFHRQLGLLCRGLEVDLEAAVRAKLGVVRGRDMDRFAREGYDPSTAAVLGRVTELRGVKLWGGPELDPAAPAGEQAELLAPSLDAFAKAAGPEGLDGYVIGASTPAGSPELERWLTELIEALEALERGWSFSRTGSKSPGFTLEILPGADEAAAAVLLSGSSGMPAGPVDDRLGAGHDGAVVE